MLERRRHPRRRVCLEASVTGDLVGPPMRGHVRSLSAGGVELVMANGCLPSADVSLAFGRETGMVRDARVVWRRMERFGVEFVPGAGPLDDARHGALSKLLKALHRFVVVFWI